MIDLTHPLVSAAELSAIINRADVKLVDATWWLDGRDARAEYERERIGDAVFFDLEETSDKTSDLPHMLPTPADFAAEVGRLGISERDMVVIYDQQGFFSAARVWWMFRLMGARRAVVLDGGMPAWKAAGHHTVTTPPSAASPVAFTPTPALEAVASLEDVRAALGSEIQLLDARGAARFDGTLAEPRRGVRSGHMPGALNLPFGELLTADKTMKGGLELETAFQKIGLDLNRPVITTCGSGVTAAVLTLGLALLGKPSRLYDGSWSEWGSRNDTPIETH